MPNNSNGLLLLPYLSTKYNTTIIPGISKIFNENEFGRYIYAGRVFEKVKSNSTPIFLTISSSSFDTININNGKPNIVEIKDINIEESNIEIKNIMKYTKENKERPTLEKAKIIVTGGMGIKNKEEWKLIENLADNLNAAGILYYFIVGATRKIVDCEIKEKEFQIGQTGKTVSPSLYIAVGVSGAAQHIAGMKDSKIIISINDDKKAPICEVSDYVINKDLHEIIPELIKLTKK